MQGFEWHVPADQCHWQRLHKAIPDLKDIGVNNIWIPPGCKGMDPSGVGATRWGSKEDLRRLVRAAQDMNIGIYWDTVLNQKAGADSTEEFTVIKVDPEGGSFPSNRGKISVLMNVGNPTDRDIILSQPLTIAGWVGLDFLKRAEQYSSMKYNWQHFTSVD
ncbi:Glycoside hydrolase superfamily [Penicillium cf. griseofulvum]|uniref:Glycoside hydrolase superfamily n=1 Tax=Penicillium cf. griseofulvum TaxID=2972120 RepID=A0A9W9IZP8_9EURO|nr:Glycoside hydrolase superfamily [Penicillium cf. griseofulvum]KAJ5423031.1 Glycoside hydrolase superfamily [Penicillium cf. griseofulvum]KAJ5433751.1 Glycoside hydrolase superfamily [Penicillium cf. griseofulvum]